MRDAILRLTLAAIFVAALGGAGAQRAFAGGGSFDTMDDDDADSGPPYVGDVKDSKGAPIADAKVTVTVKAFNSSLVLRADDQGHFMVKGFDKSVNPDEVEIACSMEGYKPFALNRQPTGTAPNSPIEVLCMLEKQ
jgi:hypothetical protein